MKRSVGLMGLLVAGGIFLGGCQTPQFQTLKILDSPNRVVALQAMRDAYGGKGYDHPVSFTEEEMIQVMQGIRAEKSGLYTGSSSGNSSLHPVFSPSEIQFFAPLIVKGLRQATPEEMVTFFETAEIETDDLEKNFQITTSGGFYVAGGNFYVVVSNFSVKTPLWQDTQRSKYDVDAVRTSSLEQLKPQPGQLVFEPREFMVESPDGEIGSFFKGKPWQVAIRYREFLGHSIAPQTQKNKRESD
ncbi:MAG: hypothetical protein MRJ67_11350 [Nitrospirales bacterium]|nr:hypothetical protein [Nitrospirales bacterium]